MTFPVPKGMEEYVKSTELCDCDCDEIKQKAQELTRTASSPQQAALSIFNFVRDQIIFATDFATTKASETLSKRKGFCLTKTNLQVALLRAIGIPARYHQVVLHKEVLKGILPCLIYKKFPEKIWYHPCCECYISEKWISCDLVLDKTLYEAACKKGIISKESMPTIDWDGENDLITITHWMLEDIGTQASYDDISKKVMDENKMPNFLFKMAVSIINRSINKLRQMT